MFGFPVGHRLAQRRRTPTEAVDRVGYGLGVAFVVAGGLTAAVTGPFKLAKGSWLAAYLVLICGVAQCLLSRQAAMLGREPPDRDHPWVRPVAWNTGNGLVVLGALSSRPPVADADGILLIGGLVLAAIETRRATRPRRATIVRVVHGLLAVSAAIGLTLTHQRS